ncbi:phage regulatory protein/antirepressor Ant [Opitutaceae bacterium TAV4]|nr:phage regulatory protein/antirepressor Ant [Opitutaceae bacterium TAV4]RRK00895.1 phage regulatory protein/antirepressor Ant [Opitutaceae bacterium TAV3]
MSQTLTPHMQTEGSSLVFLKDGLAVTTSLAIADGTQNQHKNVLELVRTYRADIEEFGRVAFETRPFETAGGTQNREVALLNEQQATLLLTYMRNSDVVRSFKKALVKMFWEMAKAQRQSVTDPLAVLNDPAQMRSLLLNYTERVLALESTVATQAPKVEALDRIATRTGGTLCITDAAKALQMGVKALFDWLSANRWIYRRPGGKSWLGYQDRVQSGLLEHKIATILVEGEERIREQVLVTAKGLARLAEIHGKEIAA